MMGSVPQSNEADWGFYRAGIAELEPYLLSDDLYWPLSSTIPNLPRLTIGGLLLAAGRLGLQEDNSVMVPLQLEMDRIRSKWRSAWDRKVRLEVRARLDLWRNYLIDFHQLSESLGDAYPQEVRWRVMLDLLSKEINLSPAELDALSALDKFLKSHFLPGNFVWQADFIPGFPADVYWYLYGIIQHQQS